MHGRLDLFSGELRIVLIKYHQWRIFWYENKDAPNGLKFNFETDTISWIFRYQTNLLIKLMSSRISHCHRDAKHTDLFIIHKFAQDLGESRRPTKLLNEIVNVNTDC